MSKCHYCKGKAKYQLGNRRWCCKKSSNSCPAQRKKNSDSNKGRGPHDDNPEMYSIIARCDSWNSGKTYEEVLGKRKAASYKKKLSKASKKAGCGGCLDDPKAEERRRKRISTSNKGKTGGYKPGSGRSKGQWYTSKIAGKVYLDSSYEVFYAQYLDAQKNAWTKNKIRFPYEWENKTRYYIPDFYLHTTKEYVETKGYKTDKDEAKWKAFPYKLTVLFREDLRLLGFTGR